MLTSDITFSKSTCPVTLAFTLSKIKTVPAGLPQGTFVRLNERIYSALYKL